MTSSIRQWLEALGLSHYADVFEANDIDVSLLPDLNDQVLKDIGMASAGHRLRLLAAIKAHAKVEKSATDQATPATASTATLSGPPAGATAGERRQLTVMFCDLVGSTALSEKLDPEELRSLLHDYRTVCGEVISRYEGFVARYVGDGILTYFGWPKAHEEDAERALRAALEIVQAVKRASTTEALSVRIGIATGPVVVGEQAGVGEQSKLAIGSTPNLASRLQGLASADQIVIASSTRRLVGNAFELADFGEHELKGFAEPMHVWRVMTVSAAASRFDAATQGFVTPMVGREQELGLLIDRWQQSQEGEGQVVLLSGEPGIGKSRVMSTLRERLETQGVATLRFQCSPYHVNSAFYPSIDNFERALKFSRDATADSKLDKLEKLMVKQYGRPGSDVRFIASLLAIPYDECHGALTMTPQKFKEETLRALAEFTESVARKQPTVMLFEDAHWADPTSLELMDALVDRVRNVPLLIVVTHRPEFQSRWSQHGHVTALKLSKLTRAQSGAIVDKLTNSKELPAGLLDQILNKTDGVPLYVEEMTKSILESGELEVVGDHYDYIGTSRKVAIPATLRDSLMARLDRLPAVKEIAQVGAAIGREFGYELLAAVTPHDKTNLDAALSQLVESGLAFRRGTPPEASYVFKHALVQDAAYDSLLKTRRQTLHTKIAQALVQLFPRAVAAQPETVAQHYTAAELLQEAIPYWLRAGEQAHKSMALQESIAHSEHGIGLLERIGSGIERDRFELDLRTALAMAWMALRGWTYPAVESNLVRAWELEQKLGNSAHAVKILFGLWVHGLCSGRERESLRLGNVLLEEAQKRNDASMHLVGLNATCLAHFFLGEFAESARNAEAVIAAYDPIRDRHLVDWVNHDPKTAALSYNACAQWMLGYPDSAVKLADEALAWSRGRGHAFDVGWVLHFLIIFLFHHRREPERCGPLLDEFERLAREQRLFFYEQVMAPLCRALLFLQLGRAREADAEFQLAIPRWCETGMGSSLPLFKTWHAEAAGLLRQFDKGLGLVEEALEQIHRVGWEERLSLPETLRIKAWLLQSRGDIEEAELCFRDAINIARKQQAKSWELRATTSYAQLLRDQNRHSEGLGLLKPIYNWFTEGFDTKDLIEAKALLDELKVRA